MAEIWQTLGGKLDDYWQEVENQLREEGSGKQLVYLEITGLVRESEDSAPAREITLGVGQYNRRLPSPENIPTDEETEDLSKRDLDEVFEDPLEQQLYEYYMQLGQMDQEASSDAGSMVYGVRAVISSPNPGDYCVGVRCEWDSGGQAYWLYRYYARGESCRKRRIRSC